MCNPKAQHWEVVHGSHGVKIPDLEQTYLGAYSPADSTWNIPAEGCNRTLLPKSVLGELKW